MVSLLGAIIVSVIISGLKGTTPVFLNAALMFAGVKVRTCALAYTARKFNLVRRETLMMCNCDVSLLRKATPSDVTLSQGPGMTGTVLSN